MKLSNIDAAHKMNDNSIDILYINMDLSEEELNTWMPKLKKGGIISSVNEANQHHFTSPTQKNDQGWFFVK